MGRESSPEEDNEDEGAQMGSGNGSDAELPEESKTAKIYKSRPGAQADEEMPGADDTQERIGESGRPLGGSKRRGKLLRLQREV